ncbi:glutathione S-transferase [Gigaspora rosea]|uniref:glutathione transferase n=1 Tax=Gigaspora rosea TaxID=44941 RepID=A0A397VPN6_9GLOM|nr:glutathione S-transferase [Gigaspora rosea]CAG8645542.1 8959_t:CDS:2 [Gigaspora rosea]
MTIKLIGYAQSLPTRRVILTLNELGLSYELEAVTEIHTIKTEDFLANKHAFGKIPVLCDGDFTINESRAICRYLVSKYQKNAKTVLIPDNINKVSLIEQYISYELSYFDPPLTKILLQEVYNKRRGEPIDEAVIKQAREEIEKVLDVYEKILVGKDYLNGEYSLADLFHFPCAHYIYTATQQGDIFDTRPNVKKWLDNLRNRDAYKKTYAE